MCLVSCLLQGESSLIGDECKFFDVLNSANSFGVETLKCHCDMDEI